MNKWLISLTVMLPTLVEIIDTSVVNVSLNNIRGSLSAGVDESTWIITSYLVANAVIIPMTGWLSRMFGRKQYLVFSVAMFTLSSFMCGISWSLASLIFFRILQGTAGGALQPISQAILLETFPAAQRGMAMAVFGIGIMFGPIIGPLMGGWITDQWSWHWIFFVNVPIGIISVIMITAFIQNPPYMEKSRMKVDYWGLVFLVAGIGCLQLVLDKGQREDWFSSQFIIWFSVISVSGICLFIVNEIFAENPIVDLSIFRSRTYSSANIIMFSAFFNLFSTLVLLPIYVQSLMGYTALLAGLVLGPGGFSTMVTMPIAGKLVQKVNEKLVLAAGILICAYSVFLMSKFNLNADFFTIAWPRFVLGIGMGLIFIPVNTLAMSEMAKEKIGNATAAFNLVRNLGGSVGVAFVTTMLERRSQEHQFRLIEHLSPADTRLQLYLHDYSSAVTGPGIPAQDMKSGLGAIYKQLLNEASMLAFNDTFHLLFVFMCIVLFLVFLMRRAKPAAPPAQL